MNQYYGGWKRGKAQVQVPAEPAQTGPKTAKLTWPLQALPILALGYHIPASDPGNPDVAALVALEQAVFSETSPLYQELVLREQKVMSLQAEAEPNRDPGLFLIIVAGSQARGSDIRGGRIGAALAEAARKPIEPGRLDAIKSHLRYQFAGSLQSADDVADALGTAVAITGRTESINELFRSIRPIDSGRSGARRRTLLSIGQRDDDHTPDGGQEMTRSHRRQARAGRLLLLLLAGQPWKRTTPGGLMTARPARLPARRYS